MSIINLITKGIGPSSTIPLFLTKGLYIGDVVLTDQSERISTFGYVTRAATVGHITKAETRGYIK